MSIEEFVVGKSGYWCKCSRWYKFTPYDLQFKDSSKLYHRCACGIVNIVVNGLPQPTTQTPGKG